MAKRARPTTANDVAAPADTQDVKGRRRSVAQSAENTAGPESAAPAPDSELTGNATKTSEAIPTEPSEAEIRARAYQRYLERGGEHGLDFDDWLEAERELKQRR